MNTPNFNIAAVERDTGLSKDVLRMWERRYGFPLPERDANGERLYPPAQVERLRLIKRLMDQGHRPGKLMTAPLEELTQLAPKRPSAAAQDCRHDEDPGLAELLALIRQHDAAGFVQGLQQQLARRGLQGFVLDIVAPLTQRIGLAWEEGSIQVFEEHLYTELTKRVLRQTIVSLPQAGAGPRLILTSLPGEQHVLGLLMVEALFALEGAACIPLGTQMPLLDICRAAEAHHADVVALSFSIAFPTRQIPGLLEQLRNNLPTTCELWVGGSGVERLAPSPGVACFRQLEAGLAALADWRQRQAAAQ